MSRWGGGARRTVSGCSSIMEADMTTLMRSAHLRSGHGPSTRPFEGRDHVEMNTLTPSNGSWDQAGRQLQTLLASMEQSIASRCQVGVLPDVSLASSDTPPPPPWDAPVAAAEHAWAEQSKSAERDLLFLSASSLASSLSDSIADSRIGCNDEVVMSNSKVSSVVTL